MTGQEPKEGSTSSSGSAEGASPPSREYTGPSAGCTAVRTVYPQSASCSKCIHSHGSGTAPRELHWHCPEMTSFLLEPDSKIG